MGAEWDDGFELESIWHREKGRYQLVLHNHTELTLAGFALGFSGPNKPRIGTEIRGGSMRAQIASYCEIVPESGFRLPSGGKWTIDVAELDYPLYHWMEGTTTSFIIHDDGSTSVVRTRPTRLAGSDSRPRRGKIAMPVPDAPPVPISIVPWPRSIEVSGRRTLLGLNPKANDEATRDVVRNFTALTQRLFPGEGLVRDGNQGGLPVELTFDGKLLRDGYVIEFTKHGAMVAGGGDAGLFHGLVTLGQMLRGARLHPHSFTFPTGGRIEDRPAHQWRGCMLDVARRFYADEEVKQFIAILAWNKLNVLHLHLADDEGWRVEVEAFPELTEKAAFRGHGMPVPPLVGSGPEATGGFYSKQTMRDIISFAQSVGVDIVPEFDMPGHCYALLQALPHLRDPDETGTYYSIQKYPNNCLNPAIEGVYAAVDTILGEMAALFPSTYFHIGADEVPADAWANSPAANAMRDRLGVTGTAPLQATFLKHVHAFLKKKGKITGAWEEAARDDGVDREQSYLVGWQSIEISQSLAKQGYKVVAAPTQAYYLNMAQSTNWHECGSGWAGASSIRNTYAFNPVAGWDDTDKANFLGVQGCIWSEYLSDRGVFDRLVFPRLSAIAETAWTTEESKDFERWSALVGLMPSLYGIYECEAVSDA